MHHHMYHAAHGCCRRMTSRFLWFAIGAGTATWWHAHKDYHAWHEARRCGRDRIPQNAYPAPGAPLPTAVAPGQETGGQPQPTPGTLDRRDRWERWGWGWDHWGKQQQEGSSGGNSGWDRDNRWGWHRGAGAQPNANARPEGSWGPPTPLPAAAPANEKAYEKDVVQQATDTITELSEATLNNLLVTVESLKAKLAEHRAQREQQERELQALREAKFRQFEEWQRQQEDQKAKAKDEPPRRLV